MLKKFNDWVGVDLTKSNRGRPTTGITDTQSYNIRKTMSNMVYYPVSFSKLSKVLEYWYSNPEKINQVFSDTKTLGAYAVPQPSSRVRRQDSTNQNFSPNYQAVPRNNLLTAITCTDSLYRPKPLNGALYGDHLKLYVQQSMYAGDTKADSALWDCLAWISRPNEEFPIDEPFANIKTLKPIIFVQNRFDPVTPMKSAQAASAAFLGSAIYESNGAGVSVSNPPTSLGNLT